MSALNPCCACADSPPRYNIPARRQPWEALQLMGEPPPKSSQPPTSQPTIAPTSSKSQRRSSPSRAPPTPNAEISHVFERDFSSNLHN
jgi:hypothetical protein